MGWWVGVCSQAWTLEDSREAPDPQKSGQEALVREVGTMNYQEQVSSKELDLEEECLGEAQKGLLYRVLQETHLDTEAVGARTRPQGHC